MEISANKPNGFKIKGKKATVIIDGKVSVGEFVVPGPGEYEISGVDIFGFKNDIYRIVVDDVSVGIINKKLSDDEKNALGTVNVLISAADIPLDTSLEPAYVIPHGGKESVDKFAKDLGVENAVAQPKLVTSADKLPETTTVVVLE